MNAVISKSLAPFCFTLAKAIFLASSPIASQARNRFLTKSQQQSQVDQPGVVVWRGGNSLHCPDRLNAEISPALSRRRSCIQVQSVICRNAPPSTDRAETSLLAWVHQPDWAEPCPMH